MERPVARVVGDELDVTGGAGNGSISLTGTGGADTGVGANNGVVIRVGAGLVASGGNIEITGQEWQTNRLEGYNEANFTPYGPGGAEFTIVRRGGSRGKILVDWQTTTNVPPIFPGNVIFDPFGGFFFFGLLDRQAVDAINHLTETNRYLPGLRAWIGFPTAVVSYDRGPRARGEPKQTLGRLIRYALDAIFSFSYKPLRLSLAAGLFIFIGMAPRTEWVADVVERDLFERLISVSGIGPRLAVGILSGATATRVREALANSLVVASIATALALVLGSAAAFAVHRFRFFGRNSVSFLLVLPIALPGIVSAIALNSSINVLGIPFGVLTIVVGHATFCIVVVYNNVIARLRRSSRSIEEASMDLGADTWQTFRYVTMPALRSALVAGALLAFALSFDEVIVTTFTAGSEQTLPIWILTNLSRPNQLPIVNVVALFVIVLSMIPVYVATRLSSGVAASSAALVPRCLSREVRSEHEVRNAAREIAAAAWALGALASAGVVWLTVTGLRFGFL